MMRDQSPLRSCPDCARRISRRAETCPHCGCPLGAAPQSPTPKPMITRKRGAARSRARPRTTGGQKKRCPQCKEQIHANAKICPHCRTKQPAPAWATVIGLIITGVLVVWGYQACSSISSSTGGSDSRASKGMAWAMAQRFIKDRLVSPGSADFGGWLEQTTDECVTDLGSGRYRVKGWVDSQNSFGAMLRSNFVCIVAYAGDNKWNLESINLAER